MMGSILWDDSLRRRNINGCFVGNVLESASDTTRKEVPDGVIIVTAGGLKGYSGGNFKVPGYQKQIRNVN